MTNYRRYFYLLLTLSLLSTTTPAREAKADLETNYIYTDIMRVTATAYTSTVDQTDSTPYIGAWNNRLNPKVKSIAVSRNLFDIGLVNGVRVHIDGLEGEYVVRDVMNKRWVDKIDIYMGDNRKKALKFGRKKTVIRWVCKGYELLK